MNPTEQRERIAALNLKKVTSRMTAYEFVDGLEKLGTITISLNCITITYNATEDRFYYNGRRHVCCELAELVIWPNRKDINDYLRSC